MQILRITKKIKVMKNKVFILAGLCALCLCTWNVQADILQPIHINGVEADNHIPTTAEAIELLGKLNYNAGPDDIEAGVTDNAVYICFNQDFGTVNITIYNGAGLVVYSTVVDTSVQQVVIIPITTAASGTYTVVLDNANGYAEGDFERN